MKLPVLFSKPASVSAIIAFHLIASVSFVGSTPLITFPEGTFDSAESAAQALASAAKAKDRSQLASILGPESNELIDPDRVQADNELEEFASAFEAGHKLIQNSILSMTLEVGTNDWPLPIPLVLQGGRWRFDTAAGKEEVLNRRIGRNELSALQTVRAYVDAQREYASRDRDGDGILEYAQKVWSSPGRMDGLYWPPDLNGELSPIGPAVAVAQREGYQKAKDNSEPQPFHGYYFKILRSQGSHAPGGKYDYVINGNMIGGFALVAWPASYRDSGVMTFVVNQQGEVFQKDLGSKTDSIVRKMNSYDPDETWHRSKD